MIKAASSGEAAASLSGRTSDELAKPAIRSKPPAFVQEILEPPAVTRPIALYIDRQPLTRGCVGECLAVRLIDWTFCTAASIRDLPEIADLAGVSLVVFNCHNTSLGVADVAGEVEGIFRRAPQAPVVIMSGLNDPIEAHMAMGRGARGYLPAHAPLSLVIAAIRLVREGGTYVPDCVLGAATAQGSLPARLVNAEGNRIVLSRRELQVLELLRQGKQNKIIAFELDMAEATVKVHVQHIMRKFNARNRTQVILLAAKVPNLVSRR